jgi:uncharacterized protein (DUF433 family)
MIMAKSYIRADEHGVLRIGATRVSLDSVVFAFQLGHAPETIQDQYPALNLEEVYGAIAFYLSNRREVDDYLRLQEQRWEELRQESAKDPSPVMQRLRALKSAPVREKA